MSGSSKPRPKPVPRKATKPAERSTEDRQKTEAKEDEFFTRKVNWSKLDKFNQEPKAQPVDGSDSDEDDAVVHKKRKIKHREDKAEQMRKELKNIADDEESDDDFEIIESGTGKSTTAGKKGKGKRKRSRSRSITPPPALPLDKIQQARNVVRQTLEVSVRPPSPTTFIDLEDGDDSVVLDPELQLIAQEIKRKASASSSFPDDSRSSPALNHDQDDGGLEEVILRVTWIPHPLNGVGKEEKWGFKMERAEPLRNLFEETADLAHVLVENLVMTYANKRLFPSVTPRTMKMWYQADLQACEKATYEYMQENKQKQRATSSVPPSQPRARSPSATPPKLSQTIEIDSDGDEIIITSTQNFSSPPTSAHQDFSPPPADAGSSTTETFRLTVRSSNVGKDIMLTVKPTTSCGAIVKAYIKKAGLPPIVEPVSAKGRGKKAPVVEPRLMIDGDKMDPKAEIGEAGLEDGDMVEIAGL